MSHKWSKTAVVCTVAIMLASGYWLLSTSSIMESLYDGETLDAMIENLGPWGPLLIVGLIATAVVVSPIPSAPIALAAGAAYGHFRGTFYVIAGAELGALIAFGLSRLLGYNLVRRCFGDRLDVGLLGSQNVVMATVFLSRLMPFISFDVVSYAAGLTSLAPWRFAVATFAGIVPASFLLAHFGNEMASADARGMIMAALALGAVTGLPLLGKALWTRHVNWRTRRPLAGADAGGPVVDEGVDRE